MPVLVLGSIIGGIAAHRGPSAIAVVYAFLVGTLVSSRAAARPLYPPPRRPPSPRRA